MEYMYYHDVNGNVFILHDQKYHYVTIDKDDELELFEIEIEKLENLYSDGVFYDKIIDNDKSLKRKIMEDIENDEESDREDEFENLKNQIKCLEEDKYLLVKNSKELESDDETEEFKFYKTDKVKNLFLFEKGFGVLSIYDTYIRDTGKNVLASLICDHNKNSYRVSIYDKLIGLNIIGDKTKFYEIVIDNDKLQFIKYKK